jgi:putative ABC transport system permease protein
MLGFALSTLRHRKAGFAGAFVALFCAAALVCACGVLLETGLRGTIAPERYAGTPVLVSGDQNVHQTIVKKKGKLKHKAKPISDRAWLPSSLADRLKAVPGVRSVVTEVTFPLFIGGAQVSGHGWESAALTPYTLRSGRAPLAPGEIVVDARFPVGARVDALTPAGPATFKVVGVTAQSLAHQNSVFLSTSEARRLAGHPGQVTAIGVFPSVNVDAALAGTSARAHTGDGRGRVEFLGAENSRIKLISLGGALGGTALLVAILVVAGTFALSIQQRQREIALLRAVAATPRQIRKMIGGEALMVSVIAGVLGSAAGVGLAFWLRSRFIALNAMPSNLHLVLSPLPVFVSILATALAAWSASRVSARRTIRIRPVEALGDAALEPAGVPWIRVIAGLICTGGAVVLTITLSHLSTEAASGPVTMLTAILWTVVVALLGPVIARLVLALVAVPLRRSRMGFLATANLRTNVRRVASVVTPLSLMVALACTILFVQTTMGHATSAQARAGTVADLVVGPHAPASAAAAVRQVPGVEVVTQVLHSTVRVGLTKRSIQAVTPAGLSKTMDLGLRSGSLTGLNAGTLAAREGIGMKVGSQVRLTLGDGTPVMLKVIATYSRGLGFGDLTLDHDLVAAHVDLPYDSLRVAAPGKPALAQALRPFPGLGVIDRAAVAAKEQQANAEVNYVSLGLIIAFAAIAVVNTLASSTGNRAREFALLRLVGTTRRQVMRMLCCEALVIVGLATVLGTAIALVTVSAFSSGMTGSATPHLSVLAYLEVVASGAVLALIATLLPARLNLR